MTQEQSRVVAIDMGSNSFHLLEAARNRHGRLQPLSARVNKVQLALGINDAGLAPEAMSRGLDCVREFAPYCKHLPAARVRVVGTQALRQAGNRQVFIGQAEEILGHSIEVISGEEEARLAYCGVAADCGDDNGLLVVDIGGASTEVVAGKGGRVEQLASLQLGCVSWLQYFPDGLISEAAFDRARASAKMVFDRIAGQFAGGWRATGCSGTLLAVGEVLGRQGRPGQGITRQGLEALRRELLRFDRIEAVHFNGLSEDRRSIFTSGVAIVQAMFESLRLDSMALSIYGLREGVAASLLHTR